MPYPPIPALPAVPSRSDRPETFSADADAYLGAMPAQQAAMNAAGEWMEDTAAQVEIRASDAQAAAIAAAAASGASKWMSGTTYAEGDVVWSPTTFLIYRRKSAGSGVTDPASDSTNWALVAGSGDVTQDGVQTLTNKTLTSPTLANPAIDGTITEDIYTITDGGSVDIDPANGSIQIWTLGANRTPTATSFAAGKAVTLMIADGTAYSVNWATIGVVWVNGVAPTLPTTGYCVIELWQVGSTIYGASPGVVA